MINLKSKNKKNPEIFYIYLIENPNGWVYVGATTNIQKRIENYSKHPKVFKNQTNLFNSITKHGWDKHHFRILYTWEGDFNIDKIVNIEQDFIVKIKNEYSGKILNGVIRGEEVNRPSLDII